MKETKTRQIVVQGLIAAVYAAVSLALPMWSFGPVQVRFSEAMTLLPAISGSCVWGVTLGCFLTNLAGVFMGANILGVLDVAVGTAATLVAALLTKALGGMRIKNIPVAAAIPPVVVNAAAIGLELAYVTMDGWSLKVFALSAATVAFGQFIACFGLGLPMIYFIEKRGLDKKLG